MAASANTQTIDQTQLSSGDAVLAALVGRLRSHAKALANPTAKRTLGADLIRAADVIEQLLLGTTPPDGAVQAAAAVAWLGRRGYASFSGRA